MLRQRLAVCAVAILLIAGSDVGGDEIRAPNVSFAGLDGRTVRLNTMRGQIVLLDFWASWCGPCKATVPALDALGESLRGRGVRLLAVSVDERRKDVDVFLASPPQTMQVLLDRRMAAADAFKGRALPSAFVIDRDGRIRFSHEGYRVEAIATMKAEIDELLDRPGD